jgi:outer membrane protein TolC
MPHRFVFVTLAVIALSGCATYSPKELTPASTLSKLESRALTDAGLQQFLAAHGAPAGEDWDLSRLTLAAFYFSPELEMARSRFAEAEAGVRTADVRPNPTFSFSPSYNKDTPGGVSPWILGYALVVPIETGGKRGYRTAEARHRSDAARLQVAGSAWAVRSAVRRALTDLHAAEATADLWRGQKPLLADAARIVEAQVGAGDVSPLYAAQARIALNRAELTARESERAVTIARSQMAQAIGIPLSALSAARLSYRGFSDAVAPTNAAETRSWAAQNRADLLAELAAYAAAEAALQGEIARQYPDLTFRPGYELDQGEGEWSLGIGVALPIFHQNQGPIAAAKARREVAAARFLALQNRVLAEVDRASADHAAALGDLETVKAMRESLERQTRTIEAQQQAGETSRLDLVRARIELADNTRAELEAQVRAARALSALEDAVQRPLSWPDSAWRASPRSPSN